MTERALEMDGTCWTFSVLFEEMRSIERSHSDFNLFKSCCDVAQADEPPPFSVESGHGAQMSRFSLVLLRVGSKDQWPPSLVLGTSRELPS